MSHSDAILAYRASSAIEAHALAAHLANEGVDARVLGEALQGGYAGVNAGAMNAVEVWIAATDRMIAQPLIAAWREEHHRSHAPPAKFQFSVLDLLLAMTALGWLLTAMIPGSDFSSAAASLLMVFMLILSILVYRRFRVSRARDEKSHSDEYR